MRGPVTTCTFVPTHQCWHALPSESNESPSTKYRERSVRGDSGCGVGSAASMVIGNEVFFGARLAVVPQQLMGAVDRFAPVRQAAPLHPLAAALRRSCATANGLGGPPLPSNCETRMATRTGTDYRARGRLDVAATRNEGLKARRTRASERARTCSPADLALRPTAADRLFRVRPCFGVLTMLKSALFALVAAAALPAQVSVTLTAVSGSVSTTGGPTHTVAAGINLAPGLNLSSSGTGGANASLAIQPLVVGSSGFGIDIRANAQGSSVITNSTAQLVALVTIQSPVTTQVVLDFSGLGRGIQAGFGSLTMDIDNDGTLELSRMLSNYRIPLMVGPNPRMVAFAFSTQASFFGGQGLAFLDLRIVPGTCQATRIAQACPGANITLWYRETIQEGIEVFIPNSSSTYAAYRHMIVVLGSRELLPPLLLPCPLHVDPAAYWFVPRSGSTSGGTVHLTVPPVVLPLVGYLQGVEYQSDTGGVFTTETLRIDCQ